MWEKKTYVAQIFVLKFHRQNGINQTCVIYTHIYRRQRLCNIALVIKHQDSMVGIVLTLLLDILPVSKPDWEFWELEITVYKTGYFCIYYIAWLSIPNKVIDFIFFLNIKVYVIKYYQMLGVQKRSQSGRYLLCNGCNLPLCGLNTFGCSSWLAYTVF